MAVDDARVKVSVKLTLPTPHSSAAISVSDKNCFCDWNLMFRAVLRAGLGDNLYKNGTAVATANRQPNWNRSI